MTPPTISRVVRYRMQRTVFLLAITSMIVASACDLVSDVCTLELRPQYAPADTTIRVGQAFTASVRLSSCGGSRVLSDVFTWHSEDSSIARVDSRTGRVVARAPGETLITASGEKYGRVGGLHVAVTDQSPRGARSVRQ